MKGISFPVYFSLGSNLGDRRKNILEAVRLMGERFSEMEGVERRPAALSSIIETAPWGFKSDDNFLNAAVRFDLSSPPHEILKTVKSIERSLGRETLPPAYDSDGRRIYRSRVIDIDILLCGDMKIDTRDLTIPHPRMYERDFVLTPLREIGVSFRKTPSGDCESFQNSSDFA